jgi:hypothetical protein
VEQKQHRTQNTAYIGTMEGWSNGKSGIGKRTGYKVQIAKITKRKWDADTRRFSRSILKAAKNYHERTPVK